MAKIGAVREIAVKSLRPYERNARTHSEKQVEQIANSIREFGFLNPILIDKDKNVIAGHGRIMAAELLGMEKVPCVYVEGLTEAQRRAYVLADNKLTENGGWDTDLVFEEVQDLTAAGFDVKLTGFDWDHTVNGDDDWFKDRERWDNSREEGNDEYNDFLEKFEQPKTTDDCYTPDNIYDAVAEYAERLSGTTREHFKRPFYPGGDYQAESYPSDCIVVDNPPFSILREIVDFYIEHDVRFFLFSPGLSALGYTRTPGVTAVCTYEAITYENKASVASSFITNLVGPDIAAMSAPDLSSKIWKLNKENEARLSNPVPKYSFPDEVLTSAKLGYLSKYGQDIKIRRDSSFFIRTLDSMKESGNAGIYGGGYLLSEKAAAEKAAAEKAAATRWQLSDREREIIRGMSAREKAEN